MPNQFLLGCIEIIMVEAQIMSLFINALKLFRYALKFFMYLNSLRAFMESVIIQDVSLFQPLHYLKQFYKIMFLRLNLQALLSKIIGKKTSLNTFL